MSLGTVFVELDLSLEKYDRTNQTVLRTAITTSLDIEKNWQLLGAKSDRIFQAMANTAVNAYARISTRATTSAVEQFRAQSAMVSKINALNIKMAANPLYKTLGIKSMAMIKAEEKAIIKSYNTIKASKLTTSQDLINIEKAKNVKLKALNAEMVGNHAMSMAAMMRAVLRFYAAYFVVSNAIKGVFNFIFDGIKTIDELKIATISVAAQITSMQGPKNVTENFRKNVLYAKELNVALQRADALSFANLQQIQRMNMALVNQQVLLDHNNKRQMESFIALSNAIALFTQGQNKEKQATQEIRALFTGRIRAGDMVALQMDALIKKQGVYRDGLKGLIKAGKEHGDTLERMQPYLIGIVAATGDIQMTWEAVSSSLETSWRIIQRGLFKDIYKDVTKAGREFTKTLQKNEDDIVRSIKNIYAAVAFAIKSTIALLLTFSISAWVAAHSASDAAAFFALRWEAMTTYVALSTSKLTLGFAVFTAAIAGWTAGKILAEKFEWVRLAGVHVTFALIDAWAYFIKTVKIGWIEVEAIVKRAKSIFSPNMTRELADAEFKAAMTHIDLFYAADKAKRDKLRAERLAEVTDDAIAARKAAENAQGKVGIPDIGGGAPPDPGKASKLMNLRMKELRSIMDTEIQMADHLHRMRVIQGENELKVTIDTITAKKDALLDWNNLAMDAIRNGTANDAEQKAKLLAHKADYDKRVGAFDNKAAEAAMKLLMNESSNLAKFYKDQEGMDGKYRKYKLAAIDIEAARLKKFYGDDFDQAKWVAEQKGELEQKLFSDKAAKTQEALGDMSSMFSSIGGMYDKSTSQYSQMQDAAQSMIVLQKGVAVATAVAAIANQGLGDPYTAFARIASMTAAMGSLMSSIGMSVSGGGGDYGVTKYRLSTGAMTYNPYGYDTSVLGGENEEFSESMSKSLVLLEDTYDLQKSTLIGINDGIKQLNSDLSGVVKGIVGGDKIGQPFGGGFGIQRSFWNNAGIDFSALGNIGNMIQGAADWFMGTTKVYAEGAGLQLSQQLQSARPYTDIYEKESGYFGGLFGGSESRYTRYGEEDPELTNLFFGPNGIYSTLKESMILLTTELGGDIAMATGFVFSDLKLNLKGKTADEISDILQSEISTIGDRMAQSVLGSQKPLYQEVGEGALETAMRLVIDKAVIVDLLDTVGQSISGTIPDIIRLSESMIKLAGGLDVLIESTGVYYDKFFTDAEKHLDLQNNLTDIMESQNMVLPDTRDGYRSIVEALDLTIKSEREAYVALINAADAADNYYKTVEDGEKDRLDMLSDFNSLYSRLNSLMNPVEDTFGSLLASYWKSAIKLRNLDPSGEDYSNESLALLTQQVGLISDIKALSEKQVALAESTLNTLQSTLDSLTTGALSPTDNFAAQQSRLGGMFTTLGSSTDLMVLDRTASQLATFLPKFLDYATDYGLDYNQITSGLRGMIEFAILRVETLRLEAEAIGQQEGDRTLRLLEETVLGMGGVVTNLDTAANALTDAAVALSQAADKLEVAGILTIVSNTLFNEAEDIFDSSNVPVTGDLRPQWLIDKLKPEGEEDTQLDTMPDDIGDTQLPIFQLVIDGSVIGDVIATQTIANADMVEAFRRALANLNYRIP